MKRSSPNTTVSTTTLSRRGLLQLAAGLPLAGAFAWAPPGLGAESASKGPAATRGRIKQSVAHWCFETSAEKWDLQKTCQVARELGCKSVELLSADQYPILRQYGLVCAIGQIDMNPDPPFVRGFNNPDNWPKVIQATRDAIDGAAAFGFPNVITFTGYSARNPADPNSPQISREEGAKNCVAGLKQVVGYAEKKNVTLCLEELNTRDRSHPMKGHPGYQGDHLEYCVDILRQVGSPRLKMLFDIYHVQIMDGDLIRNIRQYKDLLGHIHVAGNPGRNEPDDTQEINYPAVLRALVDVGYTGYVGQEFIPTRNPYQSLREAVALCDV